MHAVEAGSNPLYGICDCLGAGNPVLDENGQPVMVEEGQEDEYDAGKTEEEKKVRYMAL